MSNISSGLGARLEARLDEAARRTQALADAVEESLLVSSSSSTADVVAVAAATAGGASGLPFPTPLRSLVAQLLLTGGQQQQKEEEVESGRGPERASRSDRRLPPLLVEFKGAGLERVNGVYRAEDAGMPAGAAAAAPGGAIDPPPQSIKYRHVKEEEEGDGRLELFLGPCPVCGGGSNGAALCGGGGSGSQGECVRSWYVGDAVQCVVYYVASAAAAAEEGAEERVTPPPPRLGWRLAVPLGVAPAPQLVYHQGLRSVEESAAAVAGAGAGAATEAEEEEEEELTATSTNRSERSSSWGSSTGTGASFSAAAWDGFACAAADTVGDGAAAGELGSVGRVRRVHRRRRSRRGSRKTLVAEEGEGKEEGKGKGKGKEDGSDEIARLVASASAVVPSAVVRPPPVPSPPQPPPSGPSAATALAAAAAAAAAVKAQRAEAAAAVGGVETEMKDGQGPVSVLPREYDDVVRWLEEQERGLRAALGAREEGEHDASDEEEEEDDGGDGGVGEGESMPLSLEARVRGLRERWNEDEAACAGEEETQGQQHVQGRQEEEEEEEEEQVKGETVAEGEGAEASADDGEGTGTLNLLGGAGGSTVLAPLRVEVVGVEEREGRRGQQQQQQQQEEALFLLRLTSLEAERERQPPAETGLQPPAAPVHRVRILRRPRSALLELHQQLSAALPPVAAAALPSFPPAPPQAEAPQRTGPFALLAGGGSGGGNAAQQLKQRREACRRLEAHLTALVRAVEGAACAPAAAVLRAGLVDEREDVVVRLHADPCPSVTSAERQALWAAQRGRCRGCGVRLAQGQGVAARLLLLPGRSSGQRQRPFMTCRYLRALFCMGPACGGGGDGDDDNDKEPHAVLPGPILRTFSFRPRRVSHLAAAYLEAMRPLPLLVLPPEGVSSEGAAAGKARRAVEYLVALRRQLAQLARHCDGQCPVAARMLARLPAAAAGASPLHVSLDDLLQLRGGRLSDRLTALVEALDTHVVEQCGRCRRAASGLCAVCRDAGAPLFPHHFWAVAQCAGCHTLVHRACWRSNGAADCPRCGGAGGDVV